MKRRAFAAASVLLLMLAGNLASAADVPHPQPPPRIKEGKFEVTKTYNNTPFSYEIKLREERHGFRVYKLSFPSPIKSDVPKNNTVYANYYVPDILLNGDGKFPGVVCLHILGGDMSLTKFVCSYLAEHGIPAIMPKMPFYGERRPHGWKSKIVKDPNGAMKLVGSFQQGIQDIRRTTDVMASRPEIDDSKISLEGISMGGILATSAAAQDDRFHKLVIMLAGGDFDKLLGNSKETAAIREMIERIKGKERDKLNTMLTNVDPLTHAPKLKQKADENRILMLNASEDEVVPVECTKKLAAAMGMTDKMMWIEGCGHYTAMASLPQTLSKIADFVSDGNHAAAPPTAASDQKIVPLLANRLARTLSFAPAEGQCILLNTTFKYCPGKGKKEKAGKFTMIRGTGKQFRIEGEIPKIGKVVMGCGEYPWLCSLKGKVFRGTLDRADDKSPYDYIDQQYRPYLPMLPALCTMAATSPALIAQFASIEEKKIASGQNLLDVSVKKKKDQKLAILTDDNAVPKYIDISFKDLKGTIKISQWQNNAISSPELFEPPEGQYVEVKQEELDRIFASVINQIGMMVK